MQKRRFGLLAFLVAGALLLPVAAFPQASQGSVSGTVVDPSGAVVADAELEARLGSQLGPDGCRSGQQRGGSDRQRRRAVGLLASAAGC